MSQGLFGELSGGWSNMFAMSLLQDMRIMWLMLFIIEIYISCFNTSRSLYGELTAPFEVRGDWSSMFAMFLT